MTIDSSAPSHAPPARSEFVTILAWIFIALSGFGVAMLLLQTLVVSNLPWDEINEHLRTDPNAPPPMMREMIMRMRWLFLLPLIPSMVTLVASIGLLLRRNWARILFIVLMVFAIIWNLVGLMFSVFMFSAMHDMAGAVAPEMPAIFGTMMTAAVITSAVFTLALCFLFGWIIKRLVSPDIRREFGAL